MDIRAQAIFKAFKVSEYWRGIQLDLLELHQDNRRTDADEVDAEIMTICNLAFMAGKRLANLREGDRLDRLIQAVMAWPLPRPQHTKRPWTIKPKRIRKTEKKMRKMIEIAFGHEWSAAGILYTSEFDEVSDTILHGD